MKTQFPFQTLLKPFPLRPEMRGRAGFPAAGPGPGRTLACLLGLGLAGVGGAAPAPPAQAAQVKPRDPKVPEAARQEGAQ